MGAIALYNEAPRMAAEELDNGARDLFIRLLKAEEEHLDELEVELHQIAELGYERYLATQTSKGE